MRGEGDGHAQAGVEACNQSLHCLQRVAEGREERRLHHGPRPAPQALGFDAHTEWAMLSKPQEATPSSLTIPHHTQFSFHHAHSTQPSKPRRQNTIFSLQLGDISAPPPPRAWPSRLHSCAVSGRAAPADVQQAAL
jgi:hypothetical protein